MERLFFDYWENRDAIQPYRENPESLIGMFNNLGNYPNVRVSRILVSESSIQDLAITMNGIQLEEGGIPLALSICNAGVYRSMVVARYLKEEGLAELSYPNLDTNTGEVYGCGRRYLEDYGLGFTDEGVSIYHKDPRLADALVLNYAFLGHHRPGELLTFAQLMLMLNEGLSGIHLEKSLSIIWLEGVEDDFLRWFPGNGPR